MARKNPKRVGNMSTARMDYGRRAQAPSPAGRVLARCLLCSGVAKADGKGSPATIKHGRSCPEHELNRSKVVNDVEVD